MNRTLLLLALAVLAACTSGGSTKPLEPKASQAGYTVMFAGTDPNKSDPPGGPCAELAPDGEMAYYASLRIEHFECPNRSGIDTQVSDLGHGKIAVWGLLFDGITRVEVATTTAKVDNSTYVAVLTRPVGTFNIRGWNSSGQQIAQIDSSRLSPPVS